MTLDPLARPDLDLAAVLQALDRHHIRWVLTGSLVLVAYGAKLVPNDIDVTPALDDDNLAAIARLAVELDAVPAHAPDWRGCPPLEWHYQWRPEPATGTCQAVWSRGFVRGGLRATMSAGVLSSGGRG